MALRWYEQKEMKEMEHENAVLNKSVNILSEEIAGLVDQKMKNQKESHKYSLDLTMEIIDQNLKIKKLSEENEKLEEENEKLEEENKSLKVSLRKYQLLIMEIKKVIKQIKKNVKES